MRLLILNSIKLKVAQQAKSWDSEEIREFEQEGEGAQLQPW